MRKGFNVSDYLLNGKLRTYSDVGCYPLFFIDGENNVLCSDCANKEMEDLTGCEVNWEDTNLYCDRCSTPIESAYGDA